MKALRILTIALWTLTLTIGISCRSHRGLTSQSKKSPDSLQVDTITREAFLQKVSDNVQSVRFITSKVKFTIEVGTQQMTLTGNLKMKRDDVIRLQLMAFGFVEA